MADTMNCRECGSKRLAEYHTENDHDYRKVKFPWCGYETEQIWLSLDLLICVDCGEVHGSIESPNEFSDLVENLDKIEQNPTEEVVDAIIEYEGGDGRDMYAFANKFRKEKAKLQGPKKFVFNIKEHAGVGFAYVWEKGTKVIGKQVGYDDFHNRFLKQVREGLFVYIYNDEKGSPELLRETLLGEGLEEQEMPE